LQDEPLEVLTPAERQQVDNATRILRIAAERIKQRRDSIAAAESQTQGYLIGGQETPASLFVSLIGKSYRERFDFMRGWDGGSGSNTVPLNTNSPTFAGLAGDLAVPVIIVLVVGVFVYVAVKRG
jgi:hypothetical protein